MGIGKRIKEARESKGLTQNELGELVGVTGSAITNYEKETSHPKEPVMYKLLEVLKVDANYLFQDVINIPVPQTSLTPAEIKHIEKYRTLDPTGQSHVDTVLDWEAARSADILQKDARITDLETELANVTPDPAALLNAAHERTDIPVTEEMKQADDDIMNDVHGWHNSLSPHT